MSKPRIGLAMITLNEAIHIPATIPQFYHCIEDIVVVDGGSTDDTVAWCERLGARVIHHPFQNDFSAQKNRAIAALDTDWIYVHDPDERLEPPLLKILPLLVDPIEGQPRLMEAKIIPVIPQRFDCFGIPRKNFIDGVQTAVYPDYQYRLFKNYCRYEKPVHEEIINFKERTEVDCNGLHNRNTLERPSRFNILHYKSSTRQAVQNELYDNIAKGISNG